MTRAILLIHGFLTGPDDWDGLVPLLADDYHEVRVMCLPGHARADEEDKLHYKSFTRDACFKAVENEAERLLAKYDSVDLVGYSMGGTFAIYLAIKYEFGRLALITPAIKFVRFAYLFKGLRYLREKRKMSKLNIAKIYESKVKSEHARYKSDYEYSIKLFKKRLFPYWTPHNIGVFIKCVMRAQKNIKQIKCPTFTAWGGFDEFVPRKVNRVIEKKLVNCNDFTSVSYENFSHSMLKSVYSTLLFRDLLAFLRNNPVEDIKPESESECRKVIHKTLINKDDFSYYRIKTSSQGIHIIGKNVEVVMEDSITIKSP